MWFEFHRSWKEMVRVLDIDSHVILNITEHGMVYWMNLLAALAI